MHLLFTIIVTFFAGMGAGLGTGFAGMSAAAVISPIRRIDDMENNKSYVISKDGKPGPMSTKLYEKLRNIQYGIEPDKHGWITIVD